MLGAHMLINRARKAVDVARGCSLLAEILQGFMAAPVLPFDASASESFDNLKAQGVRVGTMDLRIATITLF